MTVLLNPTQAGREIGRTVSVVDDFTWYVTAHNFTTVATDSGTVAVSDAARGVVTLTPSDGTVANNDETYLKGTTEVFLFAANKPIEFEARVQFTEGNTDDVNILVGLMNAVAANSLLDDGGGPAASYTGMNLHKVDGGTKWIAECSVGTTQVTTTSTTTAGGSAYQVVRIEFRPISSTLGEVTYFVDGVQLVDTNNIPICHQFTYTNATEMQVAFGIKNGADTTAEALLVDYVKCEQTR